ncbi:MAG: choline-sulfatase [Planctomycetaceae bacterium]|jgi:arylsulfatase A-like enzyme|nr:choline-sulfatase [Planctomycetaceae bacterium]MDP7275137.1 sulfatase-like hydrolase/transferase [Planctomycetaceae bacterium]
MKRLFLAVATLSVMAGSVVEAARRPNILFLFADDQRADTVAAYGNRHIKTPHIDRLVHAGFSFHRNYCMGSTHGAVCQPSRAMLMSGRTLWRVPMNLKGVPILPEVLGRNGYVTFGTGKWHNRAESFIRGFQNGRAVFIGGMSNHLKVPIRDLTSDGKLTPPRPARKFSSEVFADAAIEFLEGHKEDKPFFAYVSFSSPHDPRQPPGKYAEMYKPGRVQLPLPANFMPQHPFHNGWMVGRDESLAAWPRTRQVIRSQLGEYYGMISHLDEQVGRVLAALRASGHARNTIVVYTADHGLAVGSHGLLGKQNLYEHSMRAPLVISGPGIPRGKSSNSLAYLYDLFPTICSWAGVTVPGKVEGHSLAGVIRGEEPGVRKSLFTTYEDLMRAVRDDRFKLIRYPQINHTQLFDLAEDPHELKNLAGDSSQAGRLERMMTLLEDWQARTGDKTPHTSKNPKPKAIDLTGRRRKPDRHQPDGIIRKYFSGPTAR